LKLAKIQDLDEQTKAELEREVDLMSSLKHPNIVQFIGASKINEKIAILMELMNEGDLANLLQNRTLSLKQKIQIAVQIVEALHFLHHNGIIHRDIKPENILIQSIINDYTTVKIADFGTSRTVTDHFSLTYTKNIGTPIYMAPGMLYRTIGNLTLITNSVLLSCRNFASQTL
jgi:serine/threonine protein kinase